MAGLRRKDSVCTINMHNFTNLRTVEGQSGRLGEQYRVWHRSSESEPMCAESCRPWQVVNDPYLELFPDVRLSTAILLTAMPHRYRMQVA
eukprot:2106476-Amphidinium_carterae.1